MVKIIENKVENLQVRVRLACFMLANICDPQTMMPSLDGVPIDINKMSIYFNLDKSGFSGLYYELGRQNIFANIMASGLDCYILNPEYFCGFENEQLVSLAKNTIFNVKNYEVYLEPKQITKKSDIKNLNKKMKRLKKLGYISA
jgi:hypothetical protein